MNPAVQPLRPYLVLLSCVGLGACGAGQRGVNHGAGDAVAEPRGAGSPDGRSPASEGDEELDAPLGECPGPADGLSPILWPEATADDRWGRGITDIASVRSSRAVPIEVCGVLGELQWLTELVCADGSRPFGSVRDAHASRLGSIGAGGRCGAIIDLYSVTCPEGGFEVYMDMYQCGPGERFH